MALPLSKTCDPADFADLAEELAIVDRHFHEAAEQHPMRRWEYAMALRAENTWRTQTGRDVFIGYDVGGAGSPFRHMGSVGLVVDPQEPAPGNYTLAQFCTAGTELASIVFCLSVLEHVDDLDQFLYHLSCLVAPGGLLFLTMDICDASTTDWPKDIYQFHWMRKRIFNVEQWQAVGDSLYTRYNFADNFGPVWWHYNGPQVYDYSFASLALVKRP